MTITRFGDHARTSAKLRKAGNDAAAYWVWANMWCNENDTGGFLDEELLGDVPPVPISKAKAVELAEKCVGAWIKRGGTGLFEKVEGGYQIHDFGDFRPSHMVDPELSAKRRAAGQLGGQRSAAARSNGQANLEQNEAAEQAKRSNGQATEEANDPVVASGAPSMSTHTRACARVQVQVSEISEARRDPDPTSQRATTPPPDATPEASQAARSEPPPPESSYDLAKRVWAELWSGKYRAPYAFSPNLGAHGKTEDATLRWLGDLARERGGADAERWVRHWVAAYLRDHGKGGSLDSQRHPLRWIESAVNSAGEPKAAKPRSTRPPTEDPPPLRVPKFDATKLFANIGNGGAK